MVAVAFIAFVGGVWLGNIAHFILDDLFYKEIKLDLDIVNSLPSLYNLQKFEVDAINNIVSKFSSV